MKDIYIYIGLLNVGLNALMWGYYWAGIQFPRHKELVLSCIEAEPRTQKLKTRT